MIEPLLPFIQTVGFPAAAFVLMWKSNEDAKVQFGASIDSNTKALNDLRVVIAERRLK